MDVRAIGKGLGSLDREVFEAVAESPSPLLDAAMPRLTRAADHSKLWFAIAAGMGALPAASSCWRDCRIQPRRLLAASSSACSCTWAYSGTHRQP